MPTRQRWLVLAFSILWLTTMCMSGTSLAQRLTGLRPLLRVLYVSGYADDVLVQRDASNPPQSFLAKPFTPAALASKIREILDLAWEIKLGVRAEHITPLGAGSSILPCAPWRKEDCGMALPDEICDLHQKGLLPVSFKIADVYFRLRARYAPKYIKAILNSYDEGMREGTVYKRETSQDFATSDEADMR